MNDHAIDIDGTEVRVGTSVYDTEYDRVLWITAIRDYELEVEVASAYADDDPIWWSDDAGPTQVNDGTYIGIDKFESLVAEGRFEIGAQPPRG